jgi:hypothetical protein
MIQGGDPTGTGKGGESLWSGKFKDELTNQVSHNARGILSMANAGACVRPSVHVRVRVCVCVCVRVSRCAFSYHCW